ncbi:MAG: hypothetical protein KTR24_16225 [Saprospiraceae bacterium]|nr:hypothetical protein [Saprospiraceae bacterium]
MNRFLFLILLILIFVGCQTEPKAVEQVQIEQKSGTADAASSALISLVEEAMGGQVAYQRLGVLRWTFFGRRDLVWDTQSGDVRIDSPGDSTTYLYNVHSGEGKVKVGAEVVEHPDSLQKLLTRAKGIWINDSYWLVMPFKLRDPGVHVTHQGVDSTMSGEPAQVLALTFDGVGVTPQNKYHVWVTQDNLIKQWAFYPNASDSEPRAVWPWDNYQLVGEEGKVLLSFDRSDQGGPSNVQVSNRVDHSIFADWDAAAQIQEAFSSM